MDEKEYVINSEGMMYKLYKLLISDVYVSVNAPTHKHTNAHKHVHSHIHTNTLTHTHKRKLLAIISLNNILNYLHIS